MRARAAILSLLLAPALAHATGRFPKPLAPKPALSEAAVGTAWSQVAARFRDGTLGDPREPFVDGPRVGGRLDEWGALHPSKRADSLQLAEYVVTARADRLESAGMSRNWHGYYTPELVRQTNLATKRIQDRILAGKPLTAAAVKRAVDGPMFRIAATHNGPLRR